MNSIYLLKISHFKDLSNVLDERTNLLNVHESCGQLSLLGIVSEMKKQRIDPDGIGSGHEPIHVSI